MKSLILGFFLAVMTISVNAQSFNNLEEALGGEIPIGPITEIEKRVKIPNQTDKCGGYFLTHGKGANATLFLFSVLLSHTEFAGSKLNLVEEFVVSLQAEIKNVSIIMVGDEKTPTAQIVEGNMGSQSIIIRISPKDMGSSPCLFWLNKNST